MNKQDITNQLLANFCQYGVIRRRTSFFGKELGAVPAESIGSAPAERTLQSFADVGLTLSEPNLFGVMLGEYAQRQRTARSTTVWDYTFTLPKPIPVGLLQAA